MEESKRGNRNRFENLAPEIISDILSRLLIEWILSCKCVCKTWYALIKDSYFVKLQLSIANDRLASQVILEPNVYHDQREVTKLHLFNVEDRKAREIPGFPLVDAYNYVEYMKIMCSLDGLICLGSRLPDPVLIFNPLIRGDYIILPKTEVRNVRYRSHHVTLGFDHSINKYKAVRMLNYHERPPRQCSCEVITIGGEETSWRQVVAPYAGLFYHLSRGGVFHQGSIYWIVDKYNFCNGQTSNISNTREYILEFDVTKEVFGVVRFPHSVRAPKYQFYHMTFSLQLQILEGGSLALMENDGQLLHIWRIVKKKGHQVVGYSSIRIESAYKGARVIALLRPNGLEEFLLLVTPPGRRWKDEGRKRKETQFLCYYPFSSSSKKSDRFVKLSSLQIRSYEEDFIAWCFKPSLVTAKAALLRNL